MLEKLREGSQGPVAKIILGLVILSFALAGVGSYIATPSEQLAAEVNGESISRAEFDQAYQNERGRLESQFGAAFSQLAADPSYMAQFRNNVLERMIGERLLDQAAEKYGLRVSDERVKSQILGMQEFQVDGKFDNERYLAVLYRANLQPSQFRDMIRNDLTRRQLQQALLGSEFALPNEAELLVKLNQQTRDVRYVTVPVANFAAQEAPTDEELKAYYEERKNTFKTEESVDVEFIVVDAAKIADSIVVDEQDIQQFYEANSRSYTQPEKRKVAHILIGFSGDEAADKAKAEALLAKVQQGEDFATLAAESSDDTFSGQEGGELDWFESGVMAPEFDAAAFALADKGDVSELVKTEFGFHLIKLIDVQTAQVKPLEDVKDQISQRLQQEQAQNAFYEQAQRLAEVSFEIPDSLVDVASETGLTVETVKGLTRSSANAILSQPQVLSQLFNLDFIAEGLNSEAIQLADDSSVVVRVMAHKAAEVKPFETVESQIASDLTLSRSNQAAQDYADSLIAALESGEGLDGLLYEQNLTVDSKVKVARDSQDFEPQVVRHLFMMAKPTEQKVASRIATMNGDQLVIQVTEVNESSSVDSSEADRWLEQLSSVKTEASYQVLIDVLKSKAEIQNLL
ncbi:SurA N-terminal domain-containing protein [Agarivorans sp. 1_MG-2023]|uniref:SurA N-terminal domain-containing protein n=1 Tax=Agarivorans sp. 1_MG-2023 TaxID=3062634 RepID=UPI0026E31298|nr:SurA N-terminal domain-containing protein [Agarivorans sp. 1_MG-2023]MDO6764029.1 SurA N-terminal domain-containing protein [Agarivorans sp. 1_MG-2023]